MEEALAELKRDCEQSILQGGLKTISARGCEPIWDGIMCWPGARANQTLIQACSPVIPGFDTSVCFFLFEENSIFFFCRRMLVKFVQWLGGGETRLVTGRGRIIVIAIRGLWLWLRFPRRFRSGMIGYLGSKPLQEQAILFPWLRWFSRALFFYSTGKIL